MAVTPLRVEGVGLLTEHSKHIFLNMLEAAPLREGKVVVTITESRESRTFMNALLYGEFAFSSH